MLLVLCSTHVPEGVQPAMRLVRQGGMSPHDAEAPPAPVPVPPPTPVAPVPPPAVPPSAPGAPPTPPAAPPAEPLELLLPQATKPRPSARGKDKDLRQAKERNIMAFL